MITVQVKLFATLRRHYPDLGIGERMPMELPEESTVGDLLERLDLPENQVKVIFVNGITRGEEHKLEDGDEIGAFPPVGGG
jgi:molybdopterin converting factor small subunit